MWIGVYFSPMQQMSRVLSCKLWRHGNALFVVEGWIMADSNIAADRRDYTVRGLSPARRYHLRVSAWNDVGKGAPSVSSEVVEIPQERKSVFLLRQKFL